MHFVTRPVLLIVVVLSSLACRQTEQRTPLKTRTGDARGVRSTKPDGKETAFAKATRVQSKIEPALAKLEAIQAICVGDGGGIFTLKIYVIRNMPVPDLRDVDFEGVPHVIVTIGVNALLGAPPMMGTSTSNMARCDVAGTLGMAVKDHRYPNVMGYITANHLAAATVTRLCPNGDPNKPKIGEQVAPGTKDGNCKPPQVGTLIRAYPIDPSSTASNAVDAAFVKNANLGTDASNACGICPSDLSIIPADEKLLSSRVRKCGRTTKLTCGVVDGVHCTVWLRYPCIVGRVRFVGQIHVDGPFEQPGDSGSVVYGETRGIVGLLFSGDSEETSFLNPIDDVLKLLEVDVVPFPSCAKDVECPAK